jgi:phospholipid-binding lipoprotein MlaA
VRYVPGGLRGAISNFSDNLSMPGVAVNSLLQANIPETGQAVLRFGINTTIGLGGIFDAASEWKMPDPDTDFGETLAVWGVGEGAYLELPFIGPTTQRGAVGKVVDLFTNTNPVTDGLKFPQAGYPIAMKYLSTLNDRGRFDETINSILYGSTDSYAQTRLIYLQNRRFEIGEDADTTTSDPYADPYADPYTDPYEDPYAQ